MEGHPYFSLAIHYEQSSIDSHQVQSISLALFCLSRSVRSTQLCCILLRSQVNELPTQEDTVVAHRAGSHLTSLPNPVLCPSHAEVSHMRDHLPGEEATGTEGAPPPGAAGTHAWWSRGCVAPSSSPGVTPMPNVITKKALDSAFGRRRKTETRR